MSAAELAAQLFDEASQSPMRLARERPGTGFIAHPADEPVLFQVGDRVHHRPSASGAHDGKIYEVASLGTFNGRKVARLRGRKGCVSIYSISKVPL